MWSRFFRFLITELAGSGNFKLGPVDIAVNTYQGEPAVTIALNAPPKTAPSPGTTPA